MLPCPHQHPPTTNSTHTHTQQAQQMKWHKWNIASISGLLMRNAYNCKRYPWHIHTQTHTYIRQHLVAPSLSTALLPYLTHSVWRASRWPASVCVCGCVWPQWNLIRGGYGKQRLKPWIMEKLIWSMDQQETLSMQYTHKNTHARNPFTKPRPCGNCTVIGNNYDPRASTFQWQRLNKVSRPPSSWAKTFYCSLSLRALFSNDPSSGGWGWRGINLKDDLLWDSEKTPFGFWCCLVPDQRTEG